jgi:hypothetical protein
MKTATAIALVLFLGLSPALPTASAEQPPSSRPAGPGVPSPKLVHAAVCEEVSNGTARNEAVVFSVSLEHVSCFCVFDPVTESTYVLHRWYQRDEINATVKLNLEPPRWSTYSRIQVRSEDRGPWKVEIVDAAGVVLKTLRFSVVD